MRNAETLRAGLADATERVAGRAVACGSQVIVPVLQIGARIAAADPSGDSSTPSGGLGGSGSVEWVGAWIRDADGRVLWLPLDPSPPENAADWSEWLAQQPGLQTQIEDAARKLGPET